MTTVSHEGEAPAARSLALVSWAFVGAVLVAAVALRLVGLEHLPGINGDEGVYAVHAMSFLRGEPLLTLRTGTDLPMNPVFFGVVVLLHALLGPGVLTLRLSALSHSLLAVILSFALFRRRSPQLAAVLALIVAVLPIHVGYARLAWDASAVPTVMVLALAAALSRRAALTLVLCVVGIWVHPATALSLPILVAPFAAARWPRDDAGHARLPRARVWLAAALACCAAMAAVSLLERVDALPTPVLHLLRGKTLSRIPGRVVDAGEALRFGQLYLELLTGPTVYRYIAGSLADGVALMHMGAGGVLIVSLLGAGLARMKQAARSADLAVCLGLLGSLGATYLLGGTKPLTAGSERYGLFLTVPSCYVVASCVDAMSRTARAAAWLRVGAASAGVLALLSCATHLLLPLTQGDAARAPAFRTGTVDPKAQALQAIVRARTRGRIAQVLAEDWWIYWPVRYLAEREREVRVTIVARPWDRRFPRDYVQPPFDPATMERFGIAWPGSELDARFARAATGVAEIHGYGRAPLLRVYRLRPPEVRPSP